ncbi:hypothetical protein CC86DRAFT_136061 [Ophiobolus disseminans]|uniref:Uncharacterized protein n=1 Tax=Ophiobolus disseminans TaxID=1469910 RepID=A0A6A7AD48_9PLEO|nr:hypothetical protein CC86DRAFT_136061 [Ophiobolus disseminans]
MMAGPPNCLAMASKSILNKRRRHDGEMVSKECHDNRLNVCTVASHNLEDLVSTLALGHGGAVTRQTMPCAKAGDAVQSPTPLELPIIARCRVAQKGPSSLDQTDASPQRSESRPILFQGYDKTRPPSEVFKPAATTPGTLRLRLTCPNR